MRGCLVCWGDRSCWVDVRKLLATQRAPKWIAQSAVGARGRVRSRPLRRGACTTHRRRSCWRAPRPGGGLRGGGGRAGAARQVHQRGSTSAHARLAGAAVGRLSPRSRCQDARQRPVACQKGKALPCGAGAAGERARFDLCMPTSTAAPLTAQHGLGSHAEGSGRAHGGPRGAPVKHHHVRGRDQRDLPTGRSGRFSELEGGAEVTARTGGTP